MAGTPLAATTPAPLVNRPTIPTGNMLTESLMLAAAERKRKKSVAASIRNLVEAEKRQYQWPFYFVVCLLVIMTVLFFVAVTMWLVAEKRCGVDAGVTFSLGPGRGFRGDAEGSGGGNRTWTQ